MLVLEHPRSTLRVTWASWLARSVLLARGPFGSEVGRGHTEVAAGNTWYSGLRFPLQPRAHAYQAQLSHQTVASLGARVRSSTGCGCCSADIPVLVGPEPLGLRLEEVPLSWASHLGEVGLLSLRLVPGEEAEV
ncbi:hypothetical protein CB1_000465052 [Camelus ferus]|nr:hypothetical protein CB1_000465052 [Camelus ferus]